MSPYSEKELESIAHEIGNLIWSAELNAEKVEPGYGKHQTRQLLKMVDKTIQRKRKNHHGLKEDC